MPEDEEDINDIDLSELDVITAQEEFDLLQFGPDTYGPYRHHLHTEGDELWPEDLDVHNLIQEYGPSILNSQNAYIGWYHIRNFGHPYQIILPLKSKDEDASEVSKLYSKNDWLKKFGYIELLSENDAPIKGCTNPDAWNYNPLATDDDGSCWIVPGYFLGQIPPQTMNNLHTTGGELTLSTTSKQYQGYYHVHGAGDLPLMADGTQVTAGTIMTGKEFDGNNIELWPVYPEGRFLAFNRGEDVTEWEGGVLKHWDEIIKTDIGHPDMFTSLEMTMNSQGSANISIDVDTTSIGQGKDFVAFDNTIELAEAVSIMENTDYQFNHLIEDTTKSPGIYGTKPQLTGDLTEVKLSSDNHETDEVFEDIGKPGDLEDKEMDIQNMEGY